MIRPFQSGDLPALMTLWLHGNLDAHPFIPAAYWESHFQQVQSLLPQAEILVFEQQGAVTGFLGLTGSYLAGIFVARARRSHGIGAQLLNCAKARRSRLTLSVYEKNPSARRFYEREGFCVLERRTDPETGEGELLMGWERQPPGRV